MVVVGTGEIGVVGPTLPGVDTVVGGMITGEGVAGWGVGGTTTTVPPGVPLAAPRRRPAMQMKGTAGRQ